jgi:hypothetical protein
LAPCINPNHPVRFLHPLRGWLLLIVDQHHSLHTILLSSEYQSGLSNDIKLPLARLFAFAAVGGNHQPFAPDLTGCTFRAIVESLWLNPCHRQNRDYQFAIVASRLWRKKIER